MKPASSYVVAKRISSASEHELAARKSVDTISFSSRLPSAYLPDLESLMFFHPQQRRVSKDIVESIEKYGVPRIVAEGDFLRVCLGESFGVQNLYAIIEDGERRELVGVLIYTRVETETVVVLHIAVKEEYSLSGSHCREMLAMRLLARLREAARQIRGVRSIVLAYGPGAVQKIPVSGALLDRPAYRRRP